MATQNMPPSLKTLAIRACIRNIKRLDNIGECPVHLVERIVNKIDNVEQLRRLEHNSPSVVGHTKEAWIHLLQRDISRLEERMPNEDWRDTLFTAEKADRWWMIYDKLKRQADQEMEEERGKLAAQLIGLKKQQEDSLSKVTERRAPVAKRWRTNVRPSGNDFFSKLKRDAVTKTRTSTPTHKLRPLANSTPLKAPIAMVEDLRREREQKARAQAAKEREERAKAQAGRTTGQRQRSDGDGIKDREARLRQLKDGRTKPESTRPEVAKLTADFLEDEDEAGAKHQDDDELFGIIPHHLPVQNDSIRSSPARISPVPHGGSPSKPVIKRRREIPSLFAKRGR